MQKQSGLKFKPVRLNQYSKVILATIPGSWEILKLKEITQPITKGTTPTTEGFDYVEKGINFLRVENIDEDGKINLRNCYHISEENHKSFLRSQLRDNDLLFSLAGTLGRVALIRKSMIPANINQALGIVRLKNQDFDNTFLQYLLRSTMLRKQVDIEKTIGAQPNISLTQLANFKIIKPPLSEQQKIGSILTKVDELIQKTVQTIEQTQILNKGLIHTLMTQGIGHARFKESSFGGQITEFIPESWSVCKLHELSLGGTQNGYAVSVEEYGKGIPIVGMTDLFANNILDITDLREIDSTQNLEKFFILPCDLLFARRSLNIEGAGKCVICPVVPKPVIFESSIIRLTVNSEKIFPGFMFYLLNSGFGRRIMTRIIQVVAVSGITGSDLKEIKIPVPSDLNEQKKIIKILDTLRVKINSITEHKLNLIRLKNGLMQQLITGGIRVRT